MGDQTSVIRLLSTRLRWVLVVQVATLVVATAGFVLLADYGWFDALYMSVITLGTIGYGEVRPLDNVGRTWAMLVIAGGFAMLVYSGTVFTSLILSGDLRVALARQRSARMREQLHNHVIVVGFGRVGRSVVYAVQRSGRQVVVVDADPEKEDAIRATGAISVLGDGMQEDVLRDAGIQAAKALIAAGPDDPANLVVTLTARALRPDLRIVARVNELEWQQRIQRAGASAAVSPYGDFGAGLASSALGTDLVETHVFSGYGLRTEDIVVGAGSSMIGRRPGDLVAGKADITLLAMRRSEPGAVWQKTETELQAGDVVVIVGPDRTVEEMLAQLGTLGRS